MSQSASTPSIDPETAAVFREDGVVCLRDALSSETLERAKKAYDWSLANPGPGGGPLPGSKQGSKPGSEPGTFYQDLANPAALPIYTNLVQGSEIGPLIASLWAEPGEEPDVWFMYEQVFRKDGGATRRTPWHQDTPYLPVRGDRLAVLWISFDPVAADQALEFVRGSHRGPVYDGSRFDPEDDTLPLYGEGSLPRLPDIEAERGKWSIVSWPTEPGDVLIFHPSTLHGGGATTASGRRRTLSLRFFGSDAVIAWRPGMRPAERPAAETASADAPSPDEHPLTRMRRGADGEPFRDPAFPKICGRPST